MAVFPLLRAMLHSTPSAPGNLWSLSTSTASRTPQKQNIGPDPFMKPSSSTVWSNQPQWQSSSDGSRWDCTLFLFSPNSRCDLTTCLSSSSTSWTSPSYPRSSPTASQRLSSISYNATPNSDSTSNIHNNELVFRWTSMSLSGLAMELWIVNVDVV